MGRPIVATESPGSRDIVKNEVGLLCKNNRESMSNSMLSIYNRYDQYNPVKSVL